MEKGKASKKVEGSKQRVGSGTFSVQSHAANSIHGSLKGFSHLYEICRGSPRVIPSPRGREGDGSQRVKLRTWPHD